MTANIKIILEGIDNASPVANHIEQSFEDALKQIHNDALNLGDTFDRVGEDIVDAMEDAADQIADTFSDLQKKLDKTSGSSKSGLGSYAGLIAGPVGIIASSLLKGVGFVTSVVSSVASGVVSVVGTVLSTLTSVVVGAFKLAFTAALEAVKFVLSGISTIIRGAFSGIGAILDVVVLGPFKLIFNKVTALAAGVGVAWGAKVAAGVQDSLSIALALIPEKVTPEFRTELLRTLENIRAETGAAGELIGKALYNAISAGAKDMPGPLTEAAVKFAVLGGQAETAESSLALFAQTANAMGKELSESIKIADLYQKTITEGILRPQDLAMQMGKILPFVQSLKLEMTDLLGVVAQASKTFRGEQLFTGLQGVLARAMDPQFVKTLREELSVEIFNLQGEFIGTSEMIKKIADADPTDALVKKLFPDISALKFFSTMREQLTDTTITIASLNQYLGSIDKSWEERGRSVVLQTKRMAGAMANVFSELFEVVEDDLAGAFNYIAATIGNVVEKVRELKDEGKFDEWKKSISETLSELDRYIPSLEQIEGVFHTVLTAGVIAWKMIYEEFNVLREAIYSFFTGGDVDLSKSALFHGANILFQGMKALALDAIDLIKSAFKSLGDADFLTPFLDRFGVVIDLIKVRLSDTFQTLGADFSNMINVIAIKAKHPLTAVFGDVFGYYGEEQFAQAKAYAEQLREIRDTTADIIGILEDQLRTGEGLTPFPEIKIPMGIDAGESKAALRDILEERAREGEEWARGFSERMSQYMAGPADAAASIFTAIGDLIPSTEDMAAPDYSETIEKITLWREQIKQKQLAYATVAKEMKNVASLQVQASGETLETDQSLIDIAVDLREQMLQYIREQRALRSKIERLEASMGR